MYRWAQVHGGESPQTEGFQEAVAVPGWLPMSPSVSPSFNATCSSPHCDSSNPPWLLCPESLYLLSLCWVKSPLLSMCCGQPPYLSTVGHFLQMSFPSLIHLSIFSSLSNSWCGHGDTCMLQCTCSSRRATLDDGLYPPHGLPLCARLAAL